MSLLKYYLWLSSLEGIGINSIHSLLNQIGSPEEIYYASESQLKTINGMNSSEISALSNKSFDRAEKIMEDCHRLGISIRALGDTSYPERLASIADPPLVLYVKGHFPDIDDEMAVAFVGPRKPSASGIITAERIAYEFAASGGLIVSGLAPGIDSASHKGAFRANAPSISVFANGLDVCYPYESKPIYDQLCVKGAMVSEYPPGTRPTGASFPIRNRIISGLSLGVVVIEAPLKSGSLITAAHALAQGRDVFAVPGNAETGLNEGSNNLLKDGAKPVTNAADIIGEYISLFPHRITAVNSTAGAERFLKKKKEYTTENVAEPNEKSTDISQAESQQKKFKELPEGISTHEQDIAVLLAECGKLHIDEIIAKLNIQPQGVLAALTMLEIRGVVAQLPGKFFERV